MLGAPQSNLWHDWGWRHPADTILQHFKHYGDRARDLLDILGWNEEAVANHRSHIALLKRTAALIARSKARTQARELALELLQAKKKDELIALAQKYGIVVKKSTKKEELTSSINNNQDLCEALIGFSEAKAIGY